MSCYPVGNLWAIRRRIFISPLISLCFRGRITGEIGVKYRLNIGRKMGGRIAGEIRASRRRFAGEPLMIKTLFGQNRRGLAGEIEAIRRRNRGEPPKGESSAQIRGWFAGEIGVK